MMPRPPTEFTEIDFDSIEHETTKAFLIKVDRKKVWLPKSQIDPESDQLDLVDDADGGEIRVAVWWAQKQGLI